MNLSTNEILFDCVADILNNSPDHAQNVYDFVHDFHITGGKEIRNNFSKDNWIGIACWNEKFDRGVDVPIWGHHMWNPFDAAFFLYVRIGWVAFPLRVLIFLAAMHPAYRIYKKKTDTEKATSGKLLEYYKCKAFKWNFILKCMTYIIKKRKGFPRMWDEIFDTYFKLDHRVSIAYYGNKK